MLRLDHYKSQFPATILGTRGDDNATMAFYRQLESIEQTPYLVEYADLKWRDIAPIKTIANWQDSWTYRYFDETGKAIFINDYSDDLPGVELKGYEQTQTVKAIGTSYQYSFQDMRAAQATGTPLEEWKANAARRYVEELMEATVCNGDASTGLFGINNLPGVPTYGTASATFQATVTAGLGNPGQAATTIANQILGGINQVLLNSKGKHRVNTVLMPLAQYALLSTTPRSGAYTQDTILQYLAALYPGVKMDFWIPLAGAGHSGTDRMIFMEKNPEVFRVVMGQEFEVLAPALKNMAAVFPCHARTGGAQSLRPYGIYYLDGI